LHLARAARSVTALDVSEEALARGAENAVLTGAANIEWIAGDAFDLLADWGKDGRRYDVVVVDPPAFAKSKAHLAAALRGYHEVNRRAMHLVARGGWLLTASCSFHVPRAQFIEMVARAAAGSGRRFTLHRILGQGADHPEVITIPETGYLKGVLLRAD
jgi:23S rRNA (cytosine1962-C5)-methyltransferase